MNIEKVRVQIKSSIDKNKKAVYLGVAGVVSFMSIKYFIKPVLDSMVSLFNIGQINILIYFGIFVFLTLVINGMFVVADKATTVLKK